jgi:hypothetical protein
MYLSAYLNKIFFFKEDSKRRNVDVDTREYTIAEFLDHRRHKCVLPGCGCSLDCERLKPLEHDFYKVKWARVLVCVDGVKFHLVFASEWITKRELVNSCSAANKRTTVAETEREREKLQNKTGKKNWLAMIARGETPMKLTETEQELKNFENAIAQRNVAKDTAIDISEDEEYGRIDANELDNNIEQDKRAIPLLIANSKEFLAKLAHNDEARHDRVIAYAELIKEIIEKKNTENAKNDIKSVKSNKRPRKQL